MSHLFYYKYDSISPKALSAGRSGRNAASAFSGWGDMGAFFGDCLVGRVFRRKFTSLVLRLVMWQVDR